MELGKQIVYVQTSDGHNCSLCAFATCRRAPWLQNVWKTLVDHLKLVVATRPRSNWNENSLVRLMWVRGGWWWRWTQRLCWTVPWHIPYAIPLNRRILIGRWHKTSPGAFACILSVPKSWLLPHFAGALYCVQLIEAAKALMMQEAR